MRKTDEYQRTKERLGRGQERSITCFLCQGSHSPKKCFILNELKQEAADHPGREYCLLHGRCNHKSLECLWLSVAKFITERKIKLVEDHPWKEAVTHYGESAAQKYNCMKPADWNKKLLGKRGREIPQEKEKEKRRKLENTLQDLVTGKMTLDELRNQGNGLSIFSGSKKEFTHNIGQQDHKVTVKMGEEGFTISIGDLVRDLNPEICQIKDKLFTIPCMVNNTNTQALCDSGACGIDVVARTFLNKAIPKLQRPYRGNHISLANKSSVLPTEKVLLEIDISGGKRRHWFVVLDDLSSDIIFGTPFLSKVSTVLDFDEGYIEFRQLINNKTIRYPVIRGQNGAYAQALLPNPGEIGELKTTTQFFFF